jgi:inner membrane protein
VGIPVNEPAARRGVAGLGGIAALDAVRTARSWPVPVLAGLDWPAHLTTAAHVLAALPRRLEPEVARWALVGSVAIDLDHIPLYLGFRSAITEKGGRPVTHSVTTAAVLLAAAVPARGRARRVLTGLGIGALLHFVRDIGTGPGLPLLWPFRHGNVRVPYGAHLGALVLIAAVPALRRRPRR